MLLSLLFLPARFVVAGALTHSARLTLEESSQEPFRSSQGLFTRRDSDGVQRAGDDALARSIHYLTDRELFDEAFAYFSEVALHSEYNDYDPDIVKRWQSPINCRLTGQPTVEDLRAFRRLVRWLQQIPGMVEIRVVPSQENHLFVFDSLQSIRQLPSYQEGNWGLATVYWNADYAIWYGEAAVAIDMMNQVERNHVLQEEFVQSLGILNDSYKYRDSLFQQDWTTVQHPSALDFALLHLLYCPALEAGMTSQEAYDALRNWFFPASDSLPSSRYSPLASDGQET